MDNLIAEYFLNTGLGWAMLGAAGAMMLGCMGSARGIRIAAGQAAGVMSEKPDLFGKLLVLMALPGTQGFYGFIVTIMVVRTCGLIDNAVAVTPIAGFGMMAIGIGAGVAMMKSAVYQGETSAAAINLTARRPEQSGKAILMPALVETYAVVALLAAILSILWLAPKEGLKYHPDKNKTSVAEVEVKE